MYPGGHGADVPGDLGGAAGERHPGDDGAPAGHRAGIRGAGDPAPPPPRPSPPHPSPVQVAVFGLVPGWAEALGSLLVILTVASIPLQSSSPPPPATTEEQPDGECDDSD